VAIACPLGDALLDTAAEQLIDSSLNAILRVVPARPDPTHVDDRVRAAEPSVTST